MPGASREVAPGSQLTMDSNDPARMARFWAPQLGYVPQPPPDGFDSWLAYYQSVVPEERGATIDHPMRIDTATLQRYAVVMHDPEGNEFCVAWGSVHTPIRSRDEGDWRVTRPPARHPTPRQARPALGDRRKGRCRAGSGR